ncbi:MAG: hypothetical protein ACE5Q3_08040, partial [Alphaproteobacteria bacterium]
MKRRSRGIPTTDEHAAARRESPLRAARGAWPQLSGSVRRRKLDASKEQSGGDVAEEVSGTSGRWA